MMFPLRFYRLLAVACWMFAIGFTESPLALGHGSALDPMSRVLRVRNSNPENPSFQLGQNAVAMDGKSSYYTWNQVSQNIPQAVQAGLPAGFDYSPWVPDGHLASGGRFAGNVEGLLYEGLDQVSADWPTTPVDAGSTINVDYHATAPHTPSVWDVWMTTPDWTPDTELNWSQMEFLGRPSVTLENQHFFFDVDIPANRSGHHVLWIAWHRNDSVGEVFFSASDLMIEGGIVDPGPLLGDYNGDLIVDAADYTHWRDTLGEEVTPGSGADGDNNGTIDAGDYTVWKSEYGNSSPGLTTATAVPEPATWVLGLLAASMVGLARRRRATQA